jgi:hypothetical protein
MSRLQPLVRQSGRNETPFRLSGRTSDTAGDSRAEAVGGGLVKHPSPSKPASGFLSWRAATALGVCTSWTECFKTASMHQSALQGFACLRYGTHVLNTACSHSIRRRVPDE